MLDGEQKNHNLNQIEIISENYKTGANNEKNNVYYIIDFYIFSIL